MDINDRGAYECFCGYFLLTHVVAEFQLNPKIRSAPKILTVILKPVNLRQLPSLSLRLGAFVSQHILILELKALQLEVFAMFPGFFRKAEYTPTNLHDYVHQIS